LRLLKQFLNSLSAVKRGAPTPLGAGLHQPTANIAKTEADSYPEEEDSFGANYGAYHQSRSDLQLSMRFGNIAYIIIDK